MLEIIFSSSENEIKNLTARKLLNNALAGRDFKITFLRHDKVADSGHERPFIEVMGLENETTRRYCGIEEIMEFVQELTMIQSGQDK